MTEKINSTAGSPIPHSPRLEATAMGITVAISTERDQVLVSVVTQSASRANVVNLETIGTTAVLASPAVTLQHFDTEWSPPSRYPSS